MSRGTVDIEYLREVANRYLSDENPDRAGEREGVSILLEAALFETGNYRGFKYLLWDNKNMCPIDETVREYF